MKHQRYPFLFLMLCFIPKVPFAYCTKNERKKIEEFFFVNEEIRCKSYGTRSDTRHVANFTVNASKTRNPQSNEILIHCFLQFTRWKKMLVILHVPVLFLLNHLNGNSHFAELNYRDRIKLRSNLFIILPFWGFENVYHTVQLKRAA